MASGSAEDDRPEREYFMELTIFAKKRLTKEGKTFYTYLTTLTRKDGSTLTAAVKFRESCGIPKPEQCPMIIIVEKSAANLSIKEMTTDEGNMFSSATLWVSDWMLSDRKYEDHSLDDFM